MNKLYLILDNKAWILAGGKKYGSDRTEMVFFEYRGSGKLRIRPRARGRLNLEEFCLVISRHTGGDVLVKYKGDWYYMEHA